MARVAFTKSLITIGAEVKAKFLAEDVFSSKNVCHAISRTNYTSCDRIKDHTEFHLGTNEITNIEMKWGKHRA